MNEDRKASGSDANAMTNGPSEMEARFVTLESHVAELERMVEELNRVVVQQTKTIQRLQSQHREISDWMQTAELERIRANNPKPPHSVL